MNSNSVVQSYEINATLNHTSPKNARNPKISVAHLDKRSKTVSRQQQTSFCPHRRAPRRDYLFISVHRRAPFPAINSAEYRRRTVRQQPFLDLVRRRTIRRHTFLVFVHRRT
ncbi:hypothetical protein, partial [Segatella oulorum]|uniref:hypothetical protein n=1 Tax=Segatella oulorum TaxID=28136 RepID=UPI001F31346A